MTNLEKVLAMGLLVFVLLGFGFLFYQMIELVPDTVNAVVKMHMESNF